MLLFIGDYSFALMFFQLVADKTTENSNNGNTEKDPEQTTEFTTAKYADKDPNTIKTYTAANDTRINQFVFHFLQYDDGDNQNQRLDK